MLTLLNKLNAYKHIIWDWNGTLIDDAFHTMTVVNELLTEQGFAPLTLEQYRDKFCHPVIDFYTDIGLNEDVIPFDQLCLRFNEIYSDLRKDITLHQEAQEVVRQIAQGSWTQSILSAAPENLLKQGVEEHGLTCCFNHIYGLDNMRAASKIARGQELIRNSGIAPAETILIGDTDHDFEVAEELGINLVLIAQGHQSFERLLALHPDTLPQLRAA
ncbi:HAD family hydrolase [Parendozoicomonas haliclonae]|uniref:phosphoglycolate phosphatase n=1 Tax=Parendozoicomonas haliclonae TaxID=1960125 RepID=A0A1X7AIJ6_9GAMM|nr:HAD hydrolase-like protein [Parendozoicomonas haliclonae]SMA43818.1 Phosphoglycolate phosphatase [Parendozoicomonas haliclonae]